MFSMMVDYLRQDDAAETPLETVSFIFGGVTVAPFRVVFTDPRWSEPAACNCAS
jgi:hypothetical protein